MAEALQKLGDNIILLDSNHAGITDLRIGNVPAPVTSIIISGPSAGAYWITLNNTTFYLYTTSENLTAQVFVKLGVNRVSLDMVPSNGYVYLTLDNKR